MRAAQKCLVRIDSNRMTERLEIQSNNWHSCRRHSTHTRQHMELMAYGLTAIWNSALSIVSLLSGELFAYMRFPFTWVIRWLSSKYKCHTALFSFWLASHASKMGRQCGNEGMKRYKHRRQCENSTMALSVGCVRLYTVYIYCIRSHGRRDMRSECIWLDGW